LPAGVRFQVILVMAYTFLRRRRAIDGTPIADGWHYADADFLALRGLPRVPICGVGYPLVERYSARSDSHFPTAAGT
jgi:hypothetical protein